MPKKPSKNHPWRNTPNSKIAKWAHESSTISNSQAYFNDRADDEGGLKFVPRDYKHGE